MRLLFTIYVAITVCRVGAGSHAAPSRSVPKSPRSLRGTLTEKHVRSDELALDAEEKVHSFDLNLLPEEAVGEIEEAVGKTVESLETETEQIKLLKEREQLKLAEEQERLKLLKEREQLKLAKKQERLKLLKEREQLKLAKKQERLKLLKEREEPKLLTERKTLVKRIPSDEELPELLDDWDKISTSFIDEVIKVKSKEFVELLSDRPVVRANLPRVTEDNFNKLQKVLKTSGKSTESGSESSTERLQAWLQVKESSEEPSVELFKILGIHKALDEKANSLLISMNVERWNFVMKFLDENKGQYNFEDKLQETINAYCGDNVWELFLKRLSILRQISDYIGLQWLHKKQEPRKVFHLMKVLNDRADGFDYKNMGTWRTYVDAYNDLYPKDKTTLRAAIPLSDTDLIAKITNGKAYYPKANSPSWRILDEFINSWAHSNVLVSPAGVFVRLGLKPGDYNMLSVRFKMAKRYVKLKYPGKNAEKQKLIHRYLKNQENLIIDVLKDRQTLIDDLLEKKKLLTDATEIKQFDDYLASRPKLLQHKSEFHPDDAVTEIIDDYLASFPKFLKQKPESHLYAILTEIKRIDDYLASPPELLQRKSESHPDDTFTEIIDDNLASLPKLLKRKPESHPDNARDQQRPRGK